MVAMREYALANAAHAGNSATCPICHLQVSSYIQQAAASLSIDVSVHHRWGQFVHWHRLRAWGFVREHDHENAIGAVCWIAAGLNPVLLEILDAPAHRADIFKQEPAELVPPGWVHDIGERRVITHGGKHLKQLDKWQGFDAGADINMPGNAAHLWGAPEAVIDASNFCVVHGGSLFLRDQTLAAYRAGGIPMPKENCAVLCYALSVESGAAVLR